MDQFLAVQLAKVAVIVTSRVIAGDPALDTEPTGSIPKRNSPAVESRVMAPASDQLSLSHARPLSTLPGEDVASVREHRYTNGLRQDVLLRNSALRTVQNSITVIVRTGRQQSLDEQVPLFKPTEAGIRSEIGGQFLHLSMQVVERESSNAYGPYGLALGRADGDVRCAYMWQWIDENRLPAETNMTGPLSVRVRLCKAGTTFDAMAAELDRWTLDGMSADRVASNAPVQIIEAPAQAQALHRKPSRRPAAAHKRRQVVARQDKTMPTPVEAATGPRYMSPTPVGAPAPAPAMPAAPPQLSGDLPAQAYLGPTAKPSTTKSY